MDANTYDIQALIKQSGIPRRTVYFYIQQGILPPPHGAGLSAYYTDEHLLRLKLIPVLRGQGMRLDEIRAKLAQVDVDEMIRMLEAAQKEADQARQDQLEPDRPNLARAKQSDQKRRNLVPESSDVMRPSPAQGFGWSPLLAETQYSHYTLPSGITIIAPANLPAAERQKLSQLLETAVRIFSKTPPRFENRDNGPSQLGGESDSGSNRPKEEE